MTDERFTPAMPLADLPIGTSRPCTLLGREILVCRTKEGLHALDDLCTHAEARMSEGRLRGTRLICPLHGAAFDVRNGQVLSGPATRPLRTYAVRVTDGVIEIAVGADPSSSR